MKKHLKKLLSAFMVVTMMLTVAVPTFAEASTTKPIGVVGATGIITDQPLINKDASVYVSAGSTGRINGDNNVITETIKVTNKSNYAIYVRTRRANGTIIDGPRALSVNSSFYVTIPWDAGSYYFDVWFQDSSISGYITLGLVTQ